MVAEQNQGPINYTCLLNKFIKDRDPSCIHRHRISTCTASSTYLSLEKHGCAENKKRNASLSEMMPIEQRNSVTWQASAMTIWATMLNGRLRFADNNSGNTSSMVYWMVNNEEERVWKEATVMWSRYCPRTSSKIYTKTTKQIRKTGYPDTRTWHLLNTITTTPIKTCSVETLHRTFMPMHCCQLD